MSQKSRAKRIPLCVSQKSHWYEATPPCRRTSIASRVGKRGVDDIEYRFNKPHAFYLRLIPANARASDLTFAELDNVVQLRKLDVLTRTYNAGHPSSNRFGAIAFEPHGVSTTPASFTQAFPNGELWGLTRNLLLRHQSISIIPTGNVESLYKRVLRNYCQVAREEFSIDPPYHVELGAIGLRDTYLAIGPQHKSEAIHRNELKVRRVLNDAAVQSQIEVIGEFLDKLFDLARVTRRS